MPTTRRTAVSTFNRVAVDLAHEAFPQLATAILARSDRILKQWRHLSLKAMPHLDGLTLEEFEDTIAQILSAAADACQSADPQELRRVIDEAPSHGLDRFVQQHSQLDLFEEVRILRGVVIFEVAEEMRRSLTVAEAATFHAIFDIIIQQGVMTLVHKQNERLEASEATTIEVNQQLLMSAVRQNELLEQAKQAEVAKGESERRLADEAAALTRLNELSSQLWRSPSLRDGIDEMLKAAIELVGADMGNVQLLEPDGRVLSIAAQVGFKQEFLDFFREVSAEDGSACGRALRSAERVKIDDVEEDVLYAPLLPVARAAGYRATQSTPLIGHGGRPLGMLSTHFRSVRQLGEQELKRLDLYLRQAADFIERFRIEDALRESEERYRTLFDLGPVAIYAVNSVGIIQDFNRQAAKLWGREPALGDSDERFCGSMKIFRLDGTLMPHDECPMAQVVRGTVSELRDAEVSIGRPDGSRVTVIVNIRPLKNSRGEVTGAVNCFYDISERVALEKRIKEQAEALAGESRRKDEFLAMLSHELRNPLAPIRSAVYLMRMQERGSENLIQQHAREIIERQVENLTKLVSDLLEISRVVSDRVRLDRQPVNLNRVLQHAIETATPLIEQRKHTLKVHLCNEAEGVWVNVDHTRMEAVFVNLLNNAAKFTPDGGQIEVWCESTHESTSAQVRVRDTGVGIERELLPRIFDLFTQADRSLARSAGGLGIGLSLAHRLVDLHGGTIEAHSPPRGETKGSEIVVGLPLMATPPEVAPPIPQVEESTNPQGMRVLVVDDNIDLVMMLASTLRQSGYSVQVAYNGPDGLRAAQQWRPDVVLLDVGLPGMDGYEVARRLRAGQSLGHSGIEPKLIAVTGYGRDSDIAAARDAGFDGHLVKPVEFKKLQDVMAAPRWSLEV